MAGDGTRPAAGPRLPTPALGSSPSPLHILGTAPCLCQQHLGVQEPKILHVQEPEILHRTLPHSWALESPHAKSLHITSEAVALRCEQKIKRKFLKIQPKGLRLSRSPQIQDTTCPSHPDFGVQFWSWLCFPQVPQQRHPSRVQYLGEKFPTMLPNSPRIVSMQPSTLERCRRL